MRPAKNPRRPTVVYTCRIVLVNEGAGMPTGEAIIRLQHSSVTYFDTGEGKKTDFLRLSAGIAIIQNEKEANPPARKFAVPVLIYKAPCQLSRHFV